MMHQGLNAPKPESTKGAAGTYVEQRDDMLYGLDREYATARLFF